MNDHADRREAAVKRGEGQARLQFRAGGGTADDGIRDAISKVMDDWAFRSPGIDDVEHVYFYAATAAPPETIQRYLERAYDLGRHFARPHATGAPEAPEAESTPS